MVIMDNKNHISEAVINLAAMRDLRGVPSFLLGLGVDVLLPSGSSSVLDPEALRTIPGLAIPESRSMCASWFFSLSLRCLIGLEESDLNLSLPR
jgi:hypothetical protein